MFKLEELSWPALEALDRAHTVIFVPISPVEGHGPHLPLGTDMYTGLAFARAIAAQLEEWHPELTTVLAPVTPIGSGTAPYIGSIGSSPRMVQKVLLRMGKAFARDGFRYIVVMSGHLGLSHLLAMEWAARKISKRCGIKMIALGASVFQGALRSQALVEQCASLAEPVTGPALDALLRTHHAGALETSLMLHLHPDLVHPEFRQLKPIRLWHLLRWRGWTRARWPGYMGEPALARADLGRLVLAVATTRGAGLVSRMVAGDHLPCEEVTPLTRAINRVALRASLAALVLGGVSVLVGFERRHGQTRR